MTLLSGEQICFEDGRLVVTNYRVRLRPEDRGENREIKSAMLEHVTSLSIRSSSYPVLIVVAVLMIGVGLISLGLANRFSGLGGAAFISISLGAVLLLLFFLTEHKLLWIASPTLSIEHKITKAKLKDAETVLDHIENAINNRYLMKLSQQAFRAS